MDVFSTEYLAGVVEDLKRPNAWALDRYFPTVRPFETEAVDIEIIDRKRRLAPLVSPYSRGRLMNQAGREVRSLKPAYIKDERVFHPQQALKRAVGERLGGGEVSPQQRVEMAIVAEAQDQVDALQRRLELMAIEQLRTGHITLKGEDYPLTDVDLRRDASLTIDLNDGGTLWSAGGSKPLTDLKTWALTAKRLSGVYPRDVAMSTEVFDAFVSHSTVEKRWQAQNAAIINTALKTGDALENTCTFMGFVEGFNIWVYADWYYDDEAGEDKPFLPANELFMAHTAVEGVRNFGAILDHEALVALPYYLKSYTENNPSMRYLLMQSAPLPAMQRPNASVGAKVLAEPE